MNKRIEKHVDFLFKDVVYNKKAKEIKEELLANLNDRYIDLINKGKDDDEAFSIVVTSIGNIYELLDCKDSEEDEEDEEIEEISSYRKETLGAAESVIMSSTILIYLAVSFITRKWSYSWIIILIGVFVSGLVSMIYYKKYTRKQIGKLISSGTLIVYFYVSFVYNAWSWSWMIFIMGLVVRQIVKLVLLLGDERE